MKYPLSLFFVLILFHAQLSASSYPDKNKKYRESYLDSLEKKYRQSNDYQGIGHIYWNKYKNNKGQANNLKFYRYGLLAKENFLKSADSVSYYEVSNTLIDDTYYAGLLKGTEEQEMKEVIAFYQKKQLLRKEINALLTLSSIYSKKKNYASTQKTIVLCLQKLAMPACNNEGFRIFKSRTHSDFACNYLWLYQQNFKKNDLANARKQLYLSTTLYNDSTATKAQWLLNNNEYFDAIITEFEGRYQQALKSYGNQIKKYQNIDDSFHLNELYLRAGVVATKAKNYKLSSYYFGKSFALRHKIKHDEEKEYYRLPILLQFDLDQKMAEAKIAGLEKQRIETRLLIISLLVFFLTIIIISAAISFYQKKKSEIKLLQTSQLLALNIAQIEAQEQERKRIAQDLHDSLGGLLMSTQLALDKADIALTQQMLTEAQLKTRDISYNLFALKLQTLGLELAIESLCQSHNESFEGEIIYLNTIQAPIPETLWLGIFRIVEELLQNAIKHAKATKITVQLIGIVSELRLMVEDNGTGFDQSNTSDGLGLRNVRNRAYAMNGQLIIETDNQTSILLKVAY